MSIDRTTVLFLLYMTSLLYIEALIPTVHPGRRSRYPTSEWHGKQRRGIHIV
ncbi:hypothetical protein SD77_1486 [Bacillus badius]|uniref:Uncharacterized protein n=1 Tax=Bacillus badius TaxID=1455 RepID=A0ABR5ARX0_BACBA|nr:hypothetical protein SD78_3144 [Bacillus badius]KIL77500.1 hypothetical protein SD77_1486 [Bacillus badius]